MTTETWNKVREFWCEKFGFDPQGYREEKIFLELAWVSVQNAKVLREIERRTK